MAYAAKVSPRNEMFANKIRDFSKKYSIVGIVDVTGLPAPQFQKIRASIKKTAEVLIVKKNLINIVLKELEKNFPGVSELSNSCSGVVGLVFTNDNPFTLFKFVQKNTVYNSFVIVSLINRNTTDWFFIKKIYF